MKKARILIIGTIPPPVGGVSVYVQRLLSQLAKHDNLNVDFFDYKRLSLQKSVSYILKARLVHINISNPVLLFLFCFAGSILFRKTMITYHGNISGRSARASFFNRLSLMLATYPILLNEASFKTALKYNKNAIRSTAFIPPDHEQLNSSVYDRIIRYKRSKPYALTFCTNAFDVSFDAEKYETYGISDIITLFNTFPQYLLIFSDPSGNYKKYLEAKKITIGSNILIINEVHPFVEVIKLSDVMIRATTTDGDSISIREALYYQKQVIASDCVSRPEGVILYRTKDWQHLAAVISTVTERKPDVSHDTDNAMHCINQVINKVFQTS